MKRSKKSVRTDGIYTMEDLKGRCKQNQITGCLEWAAGTYRANGVVWYAPEKRSMALTTAYGLLAGRKLAPGQVWYPTCGNSLCISHRKIGTRSDQWKAIRPFLPPEHYARMAQAHRSKSRYSPELKAMIIQSNESHVEVAKKTGLHYTTVSKIRRGQMWAEGAVNSSVFNWRPAA